MVQRSNIKNWSKGCIKQTIEQLRVVSIYCMCFRNGEKGNYAIGIITRPVLMEDAQEDNSLYTTVEVCVVDIYVCKFPCIGIFYLIRHLTVLSAAHGKFLSTTLNLLFLPILSCFSPRNIMTLALST